MVVQQRKENLLAAPLALLMGGARENQKLIRLPICYLQLQQQQHFYICLQSVFYSFPSQHIHTRHKTFSWPLFCLFPQLFWIKGNSVWGKNRSDGNRMVILTQLVKSQKCYKMQNPPLLCIHKMYPEYTLQQNTNLTKQEMFDKNRYFTAVCYTGLKQKLSKCSFSLSPPVFCI